VGTLKIHHHSASVIQRYYRGHKGRKDANIEREKYLFSRSQMRGIELGRNILAEHKSHATRLQSELNILTKDKKLLEEKVRQITKEIEKFQEQTESLESSMQQVCMAEVSLKSSIYSSARAAADVMIREKKS
jgi:predicted  nucleic acid-binding Zn-ribbon protein